MCGRNPPERGKNKPRLSTINLLAEALDMDVYELVHRTIEAMSIPKKTYQ